jgi:hypothetical protein
MLFKFLFLGTGFYDNHLIVTTGIVRASTINLIWDKWDTSVDVIYEIFEEAGFDITPQNEDRLLCMRIRIAGRFENGYCSFQNTDILRSLLLEGVSKSWELNSLVSLQLMVAPQWSLCKTSCKCCKFLCFFFDSIRASS